MRSRNLPHSHHQGGAPVFFTSVLDCAYTSMESCRLCFAMPWTSSHVQHIWPVVVVERRRLEVFEDREIIGEVYIVSLPGRTRDD
jgi:hypothetical protein